MANSLSSILDLEDEAVMLLEKGIVEKGEASLIFEAVYHNKPHKDFVLGVCQMSPEDEKTRGVFYRLPIEAKKTLPDDLLSGLYKRLFGEELPLPQSLKTVN